MPTVDDNASGSDASTAQQTISEITDDLIKSHPVYKELEEKHAAARTGMDQSNLSKKELLAENARLKVLAGEEEAVVQATTKTDEPQYVTKDDLWLLQNAKDVELYGDDKYKADIERGIPKDYALENAKLRFTTNPDKVRLERQQTMASGSNASTRNLSSDDDLTQTELDGIAQGLYSKETALKYRELKKSRGQL